MFLFKFGEVFSPDWFQFGAFCQEVQLCLHFVLLAQLAEAFFFGKPRLLVSAGLDGQAVLTESVLCQGGSVFGISHCAQVICHGVLSL